MLEKGQIALLKVKDILPNRFQPRIRFDEVKLNELAESIRKYGVIQPIVVRRVGDKYEIIAGERRFKASNLANKETIPAIILNLTDRDSEEIALLENIQREDLTPIEEAVSYKRILDIGYITQEELAKKLGKTQSTIANKIRLLNLDDSVQEALLNGDISERHARSLLRLHAKELQKQLVNRIIDERLTVKNTDKEIRKILDEEEKRELKPITREKRAIPVASHKIIKVNPPEELLEKERGIKEMNNMMPDQGQIPNQPIYNNTNMPNPNENYNQPMPGPMPNVPPLPDRPSTPEVTPTPTVIPEQNPIPNQGYNVPEPPVQEGYNQPMMQQSPNIPPMPEIPVMPSQEPVNPQPQIEEPVQPMPQSENIVMPSNLDPVGPQVENPVMSVPVPDSDIIEANSEPIISQQNPVNNGTPLVNMPQSSNLIQAINMVRDCVLNIEKLGFMINVEEMDLEQKYQITINLNKE